MGGGNDDGGCGNDEPLETAAALLKRIQQERAQRYQQQLADWQTNGGSKPKAPKPLPPLTAEELAELPELPDGWGWFKLADLSDISGGLTKNQKREALLIRRPFLRVGNVYANRLELGDMHDTGISEAEIERVTLVKGDILVVEGNGSVDQIGRVAVWNGAINGCVHQNHLIKARPLNLVCSEFILYFLMSELGRKFIVRAASSTSGLHTLSISKVESLFVPFCVREEQEILLSELSSKLSLANQLDQTIATSLQQAEALRQSILKKAFSGQLVAQDPHDEHASALLVRIKAERANAEKSSAVRQRSKRG
jgi:type I restriction enzyme S subunit